jgi:hypothetical protein
MKSPCVADADGPWIDPKVETDLTDRCKAAWHVPVSQLPNAMLATFLRQRIGLQVVVPEAQKRVRAGFTDETELYDEELSEALLCVAEPPHESSPAKASHADTIVRAFLALVGISSLVAAWFASVLFLKAALIVVATGALFCAFHQLAKIMIGLAFLPVEWLLELVARCVKRRVD